ncbi:Alpha/Beta hydrolase protein [Flagelloscypha sp. PMI_526]|nr:Alpha/Beta hydrolase protein [Flagelloscypha sp. PMI_526]
MSRFIEVTATDGTIVKYRYNISIPTNHHATSIDLGIPTILFIHPEYVASEVWQNQFISTLRRFNLVAFDLRAHGETGGKVPASYSRVEAADDTAKFMDALNLPPTHIVGNSLGADIALQLAITHPEKCASTTLISPIPDQEPEDTIAGRKEILDLWLESYDTTNASAMSDAGWGCLQLLYNNADNPLIRSTVTLNAPRAQKIWGKENADILKTVTFSYFTNNRTPRTQAEYSCISGPVLIVHAMGDLGTPMELSEQLRSTLYDARVRVELVTIEDAPRLSPVTHPIPVNTAVERFLISLTGRPSTPKPIVSPWDEKLKEEGWVPPPDLVNSDDSGEEQEFKLYGTDDKDLLQIASNFVN